LRSTRRRDTSAMEEGDLADAAGTTPPPVAAPRGKSFYDTSLVEAAREAAGGGTRMREESQIKLLANWLTKVRDAGRAAARRSHLHNITLHFGCVNAGGVVARARLLANEHTVVRAQRMHMRGRTRRAQNDSPLLRFTRGADATSAVRFVYAVATDAFFLDVAAGPVYKPTEGGCRAAMT
jgi:hypothetical protein